MAQTLLAIFDTPDEAVATARALRREGFTRLELMSAEPIHNGLAEDEARSYIGWFALLGAGLGAGLAIWLTVWTSRRVNIVTGGMPISTPWTFAIIVFELAMLGAILTTLARMIFEARLARPRAPKDYDEAVAQDKTVLAVYCGEAELVNAAESLLAKTGATVRKKG